MTLMKQERRARAAPGELRCSIAAILGEPLRLHRHRKRHDRPTCSGGGDPLIVLIGETAFEIGLQPDGTGRYVPRAIFRLGTEEVLNTSLVDGIGLGNAAEVQGVK